MRARVKRHLWLAVIAVFDDVLNPLFELLDKNITLVGDGDGSNLPEVANQFNRGAQY